MTLPLAINPGDPGHIPDHEEIHELLERLDDQSTFLVTGVAQDPLADRPAPALDNLGLFWYATDVPSLAYSTGSAWIEVLSNASANTFTAVNNFDDDVFFGSGRPWVDVQEQQVGAAGDGITNDTAAFQAARVLIDSLSARNGGIIFASEGDYLLDNDALDFADTQGITIMGVGMPSGGAVTASVLRFTDTSGSRCIDARTTAGFKLKGLYIVQSGAGFAGYVVDYRHSATAMDSQLGIIEDCWISCVSTARAVNLFRTHSMAFRHSVFSGGANALHGGQSQYANRIVVDDCIFIGQVDAPILDPTGSGGQTWTVTNNSFQQLASGATGVIRSTVRMTGLVFMGNWVGDGNNTGIVIDAVAIDGLLCVGNFISHADKAIRYNGAFIGTGALIAANIFSEITTAVVDMATGPPVVAGFVYLGNYFHGTIGARILGAPSSDSIYSEGSNVTKVVGVLRATLGLGTVHEGANTPTGGVSGDIRAGTGKIWLNDGGTWKSATVA